MIEYPTIRHYSKCPQEHCVAFDKLDGSNIRIKWTSKNGFCLFGSRTQLLDEGHPFLGSVVPYFKTNLEDILWDVIQEHFCKEYELIFFGEYFGAKSFAGWHDKEDPKKLVLFDILIGKKNRKFLLPQDFIDILSGKVEIPRIIRVGDLDDQFVEDVKEGRFFGVDEGVVCKGTKRNGAYRGHVWMCKIKTNAYREKLKAKYGQEEYEKYW